MWNFHMQNSMMLICFLLLTFFMQLRAESPPDPPNRTIQGQGVMGLDFSTSGNNVQIGLFVINVNDTPAGFDVKFEFANSCQFKCGTTRAIPMTDLVWNHISGGLGSGLSEPLDNDIFHNRQPGGTVYYWTPTGSGQKSETLNYIMELKATWDQPAGILAGFYYETLIATIEMKY